MTFGMEAAVLGNISYILLRRNEWSTQNPYHSTDSNIHAIFSDVF